MRRENGFTLIEIILGIAIIGLVITALFNINMAGFNFLNYNQDRVELQNQARLITTNLEKSIRNGLSVSPILSNNALAIITPDNPDSNNMVYYINNNQLIMGYIDQPIETIKVYDIGEIDSNTYNKRNITDSLITSNSFNIDPDGKLITFTFELNKDKSSYKITNKFYPRVLN